MKTVNLKLQGLSHPADDTKGEVCHDEPTVVENEKVVTPSVSDGNYCDDCCFDIKRAL